MKSFLYFILAIFAFNNVFSKNFLFVDDTVRVGEVIVGEPKTLQITIKNNSDERISLVGFKEFDDYDYYSLNFNPTTIEANSNVNFTIEVNPKHNIDTYLNLFIKYNFEDNSIQYLPITVFAKGVLSNPYYNSTQNKWGADLYSALKSLISNHKSYTYKQARTILWTGADRFDGYVECLYTGRTKKVDDVPDFEQYDSDGFNTEHLWPRAFGADDEPELSDMFHIVPTFKTANTKRDNYPFDYVTLNVAYEDGGSKLGKNAKGEIVFEPRNISKGNVARSLFYFATRYGNMDNNLTKQEKSLREWNINDIPDQKEINRNDSIYVYQTNRNPYIDFPQFLERMPDLSSGGGVIPNYSEVSLIDTIYQLEGIVRDDELYLETYLFNKGNVASTIQGIELSPFDKNFKFNLSKISSTLRPNAIHTTHIIYDAKSNDGKSVNDTVVVKVELSNGKIFSQKYVIKATINSVEKQLENETKVLNNPSNLNQIIELAENFEINSASFALVNLSGDIIYSSNLLSHSIDLNSLEINLESGSYFVNIKNNNYSISKKIIVIK